jgi:hypothetical protein
MVLGPVIIMTDLKASRKMGFQWGVSTKIITRKYRNWYHVALH